MPYRNETCDIACASETMLLFVYAGASETKLLFVYALVQLELSGLQPKREVIRTSSLMADSTSILCKHFDALSSVTRSST